MPKRAEASETNILHPTYVWARLVVRAGIYYTSVHHIRKSTGIMVDAKTEKQKKENLRLAMNKLDERLGSYLNPISRKTSSVITAGDAFKEFVKYKSIELSKKSIGDYLNLFNLYIDENQELSNTIGIRERINQVNTEKEYSPNTLNGYMTKLRSFFDYCIDEHYCDKNPVSAIMIPAEVPPEIKTFTQGEIDSIIKQLRQGENYRRFTEEREELILFIRLLSVAGLRTGEALKLRVEDIDMIEGGIRIDGKRNRQNVKKIRFVPFKVLPEVGEICEKLIYRTKENSEKVLRKPDEKVFSWKHSKNPADNLKSAMTSLGIDTEAKSLHALRKTALNRWEKELGFPAEVRNLLAGNSAAVKKHYYREHTLQDTISTIDNLKTFTGLGV